MELSSSEPNDPEALTAPFDVYKPVPYESEAFVDPKKPSKGDAMHNYELDYDELHFVKELGRGYWELVDILSFSSGLLELLCLQNGEEIRWQ